jgi:hypothetical protein
MNNLQVTMPCPNCNVTVRLQITMINRRVRCPRCRCEFLATPDDKAQVFPVSGEVETVETRSLEMLCAATKKKFTLTFERKNPAEKYRLARRHNERADKAGKDAATRDARETFNANDFDWTGFKCEWCGCDLFGCSENCCKTLFCGALAVEVDAGLYASCPSCGKTEHYIWDLPKVYGSSSETISPDSNRTAPYTRSCPQFPPSKQTDKELPPAKPREIPPSQTNRLSNGRP